MSLQGKRVLVTGAGGFLGGHLVRRLCADGIATAALLSGSGRAAQMDCAVYGADLRSFDQTWQVVSDFRPDVVFHLASHPDAPESREQAAAAVHGSVGMTLNLLEAARMEGVGLLVYGDSSKVYGNCAVPFTSAHQPEPLCSYAIGKLASWELCRMYHRLHDLNVVSIRPTIIYGPGQGHNLISGILKQIWGGAPRIDLLGGMQTRDPLYVDDAVTAFIRAGERGEMLGGEIINIGGGQEQTVHALAVEVVKACGAAIEVSVQPQGIRRNDMLRSFCDNREAAHLLQWSPQVTFAEGLQRTLASVHAGGIKSALVCK